MRKMMVSVLVAAWFMVGGAAYAQIGIFEANGDVGATAKKGAVEFDAIAQSYRISGGGENMWGTVDAFHFVWKRMPGDFALSADIHFMGTGGNAHRKACLIIRQTLDADAPYADAVVHGDGLTSLQYRETKGDRTYEIQSNVSGPRKLRLEKRGKYVSMSIAKEGEELREAGGSARLRFDGPVYVGLAVCAHDNNALETAVFRNVELKELPPAQAAEARGRPAVISTLETVPLASRDRRVVLVTKGLIEAPNWSKDNFLYYNSGGRIYKVPVAGGEPQVIDTGFAIRNNNDHGISPDGTLLAISDQSQEQRRSTIYTVPIGGGTPKRVTPLVPSYWHGWSPDGKRVVYCGERNGEFDIYSISLEGGEEKRLTSEKGLDDGPEYSPDGKYIYFNSDRSGSMQIWRMNADGTSPEQITKDDYNNWFPHPSPDGRWIVILSYDKNVTGHPENKDVTLRLMPTAGGAIQVLAKLFGGQGTINVPSWSPDSRRVAFVSYQIAR